VSLPVRPPSDPRVKPLCTFRDSLPVVTCPSKAGIAPSGLGKYCYIQDATYDFGYGMGLIGPSVSVQSHRRSVAGLKPGIVLSVSSKYRSGLDATYHFGNGIGSLAPQRLSISASPPSPDKPGHTVVHMSKSCLPKAQYHSLTPLSRLALHHQGLAIIEYG